MNFLDPRLPDRFWSKCMPEPNGGCWLWFGFVNPDGYGQFTFRGRHGRSAHRVAYDVLVGQTEMSLDHLCRVRCCVNPAHLEPVSAKENARRGLSGVLKTHCANGHPINDSNTYTYQLRGSQRRCCRVCNRNLRRRQAAARKAA